ncbi:MAG: NADH:ubiquinone oxidoreductase subunit M [Phycisphaerae bacterium]|jgi:NADH-quinone oxidoreductase subunit M|nr:MAG: NADH:ubiquinone oxidoreductase subunit M [Phycisphaerae bacterium]
MMASTALFLLILVPLIGAIFATMMKSVVIVRSWALLVSFLCFACAIVAGVSLEPGQAITWGVVGNNPISIPEIGFGFRLACDGISLWMILLATLVTPLAVLSVDDSINRQENAHWYYAWMLLLLGGLTGTFLSADALLFYFFFELTLIPCLFLIGIWGGVERRQAAGKFFIYTFSGSVFLLVSIIYLASRAGSFQISTMTQTAYTSQELFWCGMGLLIGFLIKTPVFPLHTWQPLAYAEAPVAAGAVIAAVLGKLGTYGLLRLTVPIAFTGVETNTVLIHVVVVLCLIGIVYGGLIAWVQKDMIRLVAYSSLSHLGLLVLAIFAGSVLSLQGAVVYMIAHGLSTAGLFLVIGMIASRTGTRQFEDVSGLFVRMPVLSTLMVIFVMASIGLPITSGFVGEFLSLQGVMNRFGLGITILAATGMVLGAIYMLHMVARIGFGPLKLPEGVVVKDGSFREVIVLAPVVVAIFLVGIVPTPILDSFKPDVSRIVTQTPKVIPQPVLTQEKDSGFFGQ